MCVHWAVSFWEFASVHMKMAENDICVTYVPKDKTKTRLIKQIKTQLHNVFATFFPSSHMFTHVHFLSEHKQEVTCRGKQLVDVPNAIFYRWICESVFYGTFPCQCCDTKTETKYCLYGSSCSRWAAKCPAAITALIIAYGGRFCRHGKKFRPPLFCTILSNSCKGISEFENGACGI